MSELVEVYGRSIKDLVTPTQLDPNNAGVFKIKIPAGNFPSEYAACEGLTLDVIRQLLYISPDLTGLEKLVEEEKERAMLAENAINTKVDKNKVQVDSNLSQTNEALNAEIIRAKNAEAGIKTQLDVVGTGNKAYKTFAEMVADKANIPVNSKVTVTNDEVSTNNGDWQWNGTIFTKSIFDPLTQSKKYTDNSVNTLGASLTLKKTTDEGVLPLLVDAEGKLLVYYDTLEDKFKAGGLLESVFENLSQLKKYEDDDYLAVLTDSQGKILIGWDKRKDEPIGFTVDGGSNNVGAENKKVFYSQKPLVKEINHILSYGQSLSMGATATALLSTIQMYYNLTFNTGPRQDTSATSVIPLVEQFNNPSADGYSNRGETHCSGMANYASLLMLKENGINPQEHVIFASTAGHGGYTIDQLKKGSPWYSVLIDHVNKAKNLNAGKSYHIPVVPWIQGENNAVSGGLQTPYALYMSTLVQLQSDVDADVKAITGQTDTVRFITYQMSYAARTWPDIAKAQLDLARENDNFMLATPMYHFPYAGDNVHLTNVGYKWMGTYFARAYKQYMVEGRKPDFINPESAYVSKNKVYVKFNVPKTPLVLDIHTLAATTNYGFKVMVGSTEQTITNVAAVDNIVEITLGSEPTENVKVRYALDYLGTGLTITGGASGNLRDSTPETVMIGNTLKPIYHVCPHFELTAYLDKGI